MENKMIIMLIGMCALLVSFKSENKFDNTAPVTISCKDTLISLINVKSITTKKTRDSANFLQHNVLVSGHGWSVGDPDDMIPISSTTAASVLNQARAQMKAYLDSLIIDPKFK